MPGEGEGEGKRRGGKELPVNLAMRCCSVAVAPAGSDRVHGNSSVFSGASVIHNRPFLCMLAQMLAFVTVCACVHVHASVQVFSL